MHIQADKEICIGYYNRKLAQWGDDVHALWNSATSQLDRFIVLSEMGEFERTSVLDIGCGFGDFYGFLHEKGIHFGSYLGIDINKRMIAIAKRKFPNATFEVRDIVVEPLANASFDFVIASGIFPLETPHWEEITKHTLCRMYDLCTIGVGVNFLSMFTTGIKSTESHYANPADIVDFVGTNLSPRMVLRHDYRPNDFTLYIYKPFNVAGKAREATT